MSQKLMFLYFIDGFLYTLGLADNPIKRIKEKLVSGIDHEAISKDWQHVGRDVNKAFYETKKSY